MSPLPWKSAWCLFVVVPLLCDKTNWCSGFFTKYNQIFYREKIFSECAAWLSDQQNFLLARCSFWLFKHHQKRKTNFCMQWLHGRLWGMFQWVPPRECFRHLCGFFLFSRAKVRIPFAWFLQIPLILPVMWTSWMLLELLEGEIKIIIKTMSTKTHSVIQQFSPALKYESRDKQ